MTFMQIETFSKAKGVCDQGCSGEREEVTDDSAICLDCKEHCEAVKITCDCGELEGDEMSNCCGAGAWTP